MSLRSNTDLIEALRGPQSYDTVASLAVLLAACRTYRGHEREGEEHLPLGLFFIHVKCVTTCAVTGMAPADPRDLN